MTNLSNENLAIHIVMRYSDKLHDVGDTLEAHREVVEKNGAVWLGKFGKTLGTDKIRKVSKQVEEGTATYLYLVQKLKGRYAISKGGILAAARELPENEKDLVPQYYDEHKLRQHVGVWVKLSAIEDVDEEEIEELRLVNTGNLLTYSLSTSMAGAA